MKPVTHLAHLPHMHQARLSNMRDAPPTCMGLILSHKIATALISASIFSNNVIELMQAGTEGQRVAVTEDKGGHRYHVAEAQRDSMLLYR